MFVFRRCYRKCRLRYKFDLVPVLAEQVDVSGFGAIPGHAGIDVSKIAYIRSACKSDQVGNVRVTLTFFVMFSTRENGRNDPGGQHLKQMCRGK